MGPVTTDSAWRYSPRPALPPASCGHGSAENPMKIQTQTQEACMAPGDSAFLVRSHGMQRLPGPMITLLKEWNLGVDGLNHIRITWAAFNNWYPGYPPADFIQHLYEWEQASVVFCFLQSPHDSHVEPRLWTNADSFTCGRGGGSRGLHW